MSFLSTMKRVIHSDAWESVVTLLGTAYDKMTYHRVYPEIWYDPQELEDFFYADPYAQRTVREPVDAAFRQGYEIVTTADIDPEVVEEYREQIQDLLFDLDARRGYCQALYWGRLYGRGGLLLGVDDGGSLTKPLALERIRGISYLEPVDCRYFTALELNTDSKSPKYHTPEIWTVQRGNSTVEIHESRLLLTRGVPTTRRKREENDWRDASVLQAPYKYFQRWDAAQQGTANMLTDASQAVLKMRDLSEFLASEDITAFSNRMRILEMCRSFRIMAIDADGEEFSNVDRTFAGVGDLLDRAASALAGAVGMPQTVLFGRAPAGLNATGESDIRAWYDQVQAERTNEYQAPFELLIYYAALALGVPEPETWGISWGSLWQETDKESAETNKSIAEVDQIYYNMGALTEDEIAAARFSGEEFGRGVVQLDQEIREALREQDLERAKNPPPEPPPPPQMVPVVSQVPEVPEDEDAEDPSEDPPGA